MAAVGAPEPDVHDRQQLPVVLLELSAFDARFRGADPHREKDTIVEPWSLVFSGIAVLISTASVFVSVRMTARQIELSRQALQVSPFYQFMADFRKTDYHDHFNFVVHDLRKKHPPSDELGVYDLPESAKSAVIDVLYFYQNAVSFAAFGLMDEEKVLAFLHLRLIAVWDALAPYIEAERNKENSPVGKVWCTRLQRYAEWAKGVPPETALRVGFNEVPSSKRLRKLKIQPVTQGKLTPDDK